VSQASGTFDVALALLPVENVTDDMLIQRRSLEKQFHGALNATSHGQMLSVGTVTAGSGVYVAVERLTGCLDGRTGAFSLHHAGIMNRGTPSLVISVVPDSGSGELTGISGSMTIDIKAKQHHYTFEYTLS
jgi:hypothetical protein